VTTRICPPVFSSIDPLIASPLQAQAVTDVRVRGPVHEPRKGGDKVTSFFTNLNLLRKREDGQTMAEYGVVLAVITLGVVLALGILSGAISDAIERVSSFL
jgi:Flp pilus assembly pilin Flp